MAKKLSLSIVIPVYNEEDYLKACLESIAAQTQAPEEVIVVDNGSTDKTLDIVRQFPFVTLLHEKKKSVLYARNTGFNAARSDIIGRIDADTRLSPDWVKRAKRIFEDKNSYAVSGPFGIYDMPFPRLTRWLDDLLLRIAVLGKFYFLTGCNMALRRSSWDKIKNELCDDLSMYEDIDLAIHLEMRGMRPTYSPALWNSISSRRFGDKLSDFIRYLKRYSHTFDKHNLKRIGVYHAELSYLITYIVSRPLFWLFDPNTRRLSLRYLFAPKSRRIEPMSGRHDSKD